MTTISLSDISILIRVEFAVLGFVMFNFMLFFVVAMVVA